MSEQPGRYQRSASGMIGAMLVLLLGIGLFVLLRGLNRDNETVEQDAVDYLAAVRFAQSSDWQVVYPPSLPDGWKATSMETTPEQEWGIGILTPDGFAGVNQPEKSMESAIERYIDEDATETDTVEIEGQQWQGWEDDGGDVGYVGQVDGVDVLVYGSAPADELQELAASLTTEPLA